MEDVIKKAIDGGWKERDVIWNEPAGEETYRYTENVCDSTFWQALGKSCGLDEGNSEWLKDKNEIAHIQGWQGIVHAVMPEWKFLALRFHEINLTEGWDKAVSWLEELVTKERK